jgi:hypothetical protein
MKNIKKNPFDDFMKRYKNYTNEELSEILNSYEYRSGAASSIGSSTAYLIKALGDEVLASRENNDTLQKNQR